MLEGPREDRMEEYVRALEVFEAWLARGGASGTREELLEGHGDLREILEGMLEAELEALPTAEAKEEPGSEADSETGSGPDEAAILGSSGASLTKAEEPWNFGAWRIEAVLGQGGMGTVYLATHRRLGRRVALKVIRGERLWSQVARERFWREAKAVARLDHPGICPVYEVGEVEGQPFMAMRYIEGRTVAELIREAREERESGDPSTNTDSRMGRGRKRIDAWVALFEKLARALAAAHARSIVHRDIKPGNLMIDEQGEPVILDFGLAWDEESAEAGLTMTGDQPGTPMYMSPEQIDPRGRALDATTDIWSLGVTLYECLCLERAFEGASIREIQDAVLETEPQALTRRAGHIPVDLAVVVEKAMEKDRERRYRTAEDLAEDLGRVLRREPVRARRAGPLLRARRWVQRNPLVASFLVAVTLGLLLITLLFFESQRARKEYDRLSWVVKLERAAETEADLYPAKPERIGLFETWLREQGEPVERSLPDLRRALAGLETRATGREGARLRFSDEAEQFRYDSLADLVRQAEAFTGEEGALARVRAHLAWLRRVKEESLVRYAPAWKRVAAEMAASSFYHGLELRPQVGLAPLGADPATHLQEFAHLRSGRVPARDPEGGGLQVGGESGLVFVLVPGGRDWLGAQNDDAEGVNFDKLARKVEEPYEIGLDAFLVSKYEMTQGQWIRLSGGRNPSTFRAGRKIAGQHITLAHPVEEVSWSQCHALLRQFGLELPTEAQWEYACRAGTDTPWSSGADRESLVGRVNFADQCAKRHGAGWSQIRDWPELDDGYTVHAPVDSLLPNPWGLHHVHGNVLEFCRDWYGKYAVPTRSGDGLREPLRATKHVVRGGSYDTSFQQARSAYRGGTGPDSTSGSLGLRPVRVLDR